MPTRSPFVTHVFGGGWATDFGVTAPVELSDVVSIPFLQDAENVIYELDGGPRKMPGTAKLNASELESGAAIKGIFDYWISGTGGSSTQRRIIHVGTKIKKDDADGTFTDLFTGLESGKVPAYSQLDDIVIMSSDSTVDVPKSWDGSTAQSLAGSPPNFAFSVEHKNHIFAAGDAANPSTLSYCVPLDPEDWTGGGSGTISISPDDGDRITGLASHKNELWVFKGPYKGSIHRITGTAAADFARETFVTGVGAVGHNTIFRFGDDLGFMWSDGSIRSLSATDAFGDYAAASLSRPINIGFLNERVNISRLNHAWAAVDDIRGGVAFALPIDSSSDPNVVLWMDIRFSPPRWSFLSNLTSVASMASVVDPGNNNRRVVMLGGNDGFVRKWGQRDLTNDGSSINFKIRTPHLHYGLPGNLKTLNVVSLGIVPTNNETVTFGWERDNNAQQTATVTQGGGSLWDTAVFDTDVFGGGRFVDRFIELHEGGQFRSVSYEVKETKNLQDFELHNIGAQLSIDGFSAENS